jgi:hypothetical protein
VRAEKLVRFRLDFNYKPWIIVLRGLALVSAGIGYLRNANIA